METDTQSSQILDFLLLFLDFLYLLRPCPIWCWVNAVKQSTSSALGAVYMKKSHSKIGETSHLSEISTEWCISLCKNILFIWEWIHRTLVRPHLKRRSHLGGMIFLRANSFCRPVPPVQDYSLSLDSVFL